MKQLRRHSRGLGVLLAAALATAAVTTGAFNLDGFDGKSELVPTGQRITPTAPRGATFETLNPGLPAPHQDFVAGQATQTAVSPDGKTLLVLTSGYNWIGNISHEYVFVYDIANGAPAKKQVLTVPNTYNGLAWHPRGEEFYVAGGVDDNVHVFQRRGDRWVESVRPIALDHTDTPGWGVPPLAAGLAVNARGDRLAVANLMNDSISLIDLVSRAKLAELDLRPGKIDPAKRGVAGGEYPFWLAFRGNDRLYVSSQRDREIVVVDVAGTPRVTERIPVRGTPNKMILDRAGSLLYVALDNSDKVAVIDTAGDKVIEWIPTIAPRTLLEDAEELKGANPNNLVLAPDERSLFVSCGGTNAVAVIRLAPVQGGQVHGESEVIGLIPTGWYPNAVSLSRDGAMMYVVNGKSNAGPNPLYGNADQYILQLIKAGLQTLPVPTAAELADLTWQVAHNNNFPSAEQHHEQRALMQALRGRIKHVLYIVKENRTYDQVLGDLEKGNGDPSLTMFGAANTPNHHQLARQFVTLDNFFVSGEVSGDGWNWTVAARTTDFTEKAVPVHYAGRGFAYDFQGHNRNLNTAHATVAERLAANPLVPTDPDILPGNADVAAPDGPEDEAGAGYLWDAALRAGLTIRHYGQFTDWNLYYSPAPAFIPLEREPFARGVIQAHATNKTLQQHSDVYYRGYDMKYPDYWLVKEWEREFDQFVQRRNLPNLSLMALPHDHFGDFGEAIDGVNTPELQMADNDYALGRIVEKVANSPYRDSTLIVVVEDDAQSGPDHVDAHRSLAFVVGPYVKQGPVVSRRYTTVNLVRTIEDVLGIKPMGLHDGFAPPMAELFDLRQKDWSYTAIVPDILRTTQLPLPPAALTQAKNAAAAAKPRRDAAWWEENTTRIDFKQRDHLDAERFNRILWEGIKGEGVPYPTHRHGRDLRVNRAELLKRHALGVELAGK